ncbi:hypothetical protein [Desulfonatronum lacustre]|uniref:hypothetical protein n=1 Tax=Desulfonatronum lacustre TaxID=66849 RepID=UPI00048EA920|nr:hypothetical protein [Desulfonatronum lacustre]SMP67555.1 hypothetical protein SAMN06295888_11522 [Desulfonatronum zhilinae]
MPTEKTRVDVELGGELYGAVSELAQGHGVSMSIIMRDLVKEAMEIREDVTMANIADQRACSFDHDKALSHEEVWS